MLFLHDANKCKNDRNLLDFEQSIYINQVTSRQYAEQN
jgi:hypothetical protein